MYNKLITKTMKTENKTEKRMIRLNDFGTHEIVCKMIYDGYIGSDYGEIYSEETIKRIDEYVIPIMKMNLNKELEYKNCIVLGIYLGECINRKYGSFWVYNDGEKEDIYNHHIAWDENNRSFPIQKVFKRFKNGEEDSLVVYYRLCELFANGEIEKVIGNIKEKNITIIYNK